MTAWNGPVIRRGIALGQDASGLLAASYLGVAEASLPRPFVGSPTTGFHSQPPKGTHLATLSEAQQYPLAHVSAWDGVSTISPLADGESVLYGPTGDTLLYASVANPIILYRNHTGTVELTLNRTTGVLNLICPGGGGFAVNGTLVTVP